MSTRALSSSSLASSLLVSFALALGACGGTDTTPDAATPVMTDAFVAAGEDAPTPSEDAPIAMTPDSPSAMTPDSPMMMGGATWGDVHAELASNCGPCHTSGRQGGHSMGQANVAMAHADSQLSAGACAGVTKGECAAMRVRAGSMPPGGGGLSPMEREDLADLLDSWVAAGQPAP